MENNEAPLFVVRRDDAERAYAWPCIVNVPMADGTKKPHKFVAKFKLLSDEDEKKLRDPLGMLAGDPNLAVLNAALIGFVELKNESGEAVPDADAIALIHKLPYTWFGLAKGYWDMRDGRLEKN